jgi:hypothetical protein
VRERCPRLFDDARALFGTDRAVLHDLHRGLRPGSNRLNGFQEAEACDLYEILHRLLPTVSLSFSPTTVPASTNTPLKLIAND